MHRLPALVLVLLVVPACALRWSRGLPGDEVRLSQLARSGDPPRRASTRLLLQGLDADAAGRGAEALSQYELALQVDPNNPYAYLCLARHEVDQGDPERAIDYLDKADALLSVEPGAAGVRVHVTGLRGAALWQQGRRDEARPYLEAARRAAPRTWGDGQLDAGELR